MEKKQEKITKCQEMIQKILEDEKLLEEQN